MDDNNINSNSFDNFTQAYDNFDNNINGNYDVDHSNDYADNYGTGGKKRLKDILLVILFVIIILLLLIGGYIVFKSGGSAKYSDYENELSGMGTDYAWLNSIDLPEGYWKKVTFDDLKNNLLLDSNSSIAANCDGYVILEGVGGENKSTAYITCGDKYTTDGYGQDPTGTLFVMTTEEEDTISPVITLKGYSALKMDVGGTYVEYGAIAIDNKDGDISGSVVTSGTVNTSKAGRYTVTYTVSDAAGNKAQVSRLIVVKETKKGCDACLCMQKFEDSEPPVITLLGDNPAKIYKGTKYKEQGYTAYDNEDGDLTAKVEVTVTDSLIIYTVTDSAGNTATAEREIQYIDKQVIVKKPSISTTPITVCVGNTAKVSYSVKNVSNPKITYSVKSGGSNVSLSGNTVKGLKAGTAQITIKETKNGIQTTAKVTVKTCTAADPNLKKLYDIVYIPKGTSFNASATADAETQVCSASEGFKTTVSRNYNTSKAGTGTIICTAGNKSVTIDVVVFDITAADVTLKVGESKSGLKGTVSPSSVANLGSISYKSNNTSIATVSGDKVTGVKAGNTTRTVTFTLDKTKVKNAKIVGTTVSATPKIIVTAKTVTTTKKPGGSGTTTSSTKKPGSCSCGGANTTGSYAWCNGSKWVTVAQGYCPGPTASSQISSVCKDSKYDNEKGIYRTNDGWGCKCYCSGPQSGTNSTTTAKPTSCVISKGTCTFVDSGTSTRPDYYKCSIDGKQYTTRYGCVSACETRKCN